jgi:uncharacterized phage protein (TIGR02218 family)
MLRTVPSAMQTEADTGATTWAAFLKIKRVRGESEHNLRLNNCGQDVSYVDDSGESRLYRGYPGFVLSPIRLYSDGSPTSFDVSIFLDPEDEEVTVPLKEGRYDGGEVALDVLNWRNPGGGRIKITGGIVSDISYDNTSWAKIVIGGPLERASDIDPLVIMTPCRWQLGDDGCRVDIEALAITGTVVSQTGYRTLTVSASPGDEFIEGTVIITSGAAEGDSYTISHIDGSALRLRAGVRGNIQAGDDVTIYPGCDKTLAGGCTFYENWARHLGFPFRTDQSTITGSFRETAEVEAPVE